MDLKKEKELLAENPFYIYLMVKAAKQALDEGRAIIQDGVLILQNQEKPSPDESPPRKTGQQPGETQPPPNRP